MFNDARRGDIWYADASMGSFDPDSMGIHQTVEPAKVRNLIKATEQQIHQLQEQLAALQEREAEMLAQQRTVQEIQEGNDERHENTL